jgi:hypothetical protein
MRDRIRTWGLALACLVAGMVAVAPAAAAEEEYEGLQLIAVKAYVDAHPEVAYDEALRRIELQDALSPVIPSLAARLGDRYAGAWYDAGDGGKLKVALVGRDSKAAAQHLAAARSAVDGVASTDEVEFVDADWTLAELERVQKQVTAALEGADGSSSVAVDLAANAVKLTRSEPLGVPAAAQIEQAVDATDVPVLQRRDDGFRPDTVACTLPYCERPLRGGVKTFVDIPYPGDNTNYPNCTTGFNATSRSDGKRYVLLAGHCVTLDSYPTPSGNIHGTKVVTGGTVETIGPGHNANFPGGDSGIVRTQVPGYWQNSPFPTNTVVVDDIPGVHGYYENYAITNEANAPQGQVVCTTGGGGEANGAPAGFWWGTPYASWTWCGTVRYASVNVDYDLSAGVEWVNNLVETDLCMHPGMSGGPVYKLGIAYALNSGASCSSSPAAGWHYPTIRAENDMNVDIVH